MNADSGPAAIPPGIAAIIPAYNEASRISATVAAALHIPGATRVIVVDDGSRDDTAAVAEAAGAQRVLRLPQNRGKGAALNAGWQEAAEPVILLLDADLGATAAEAWKLLEPVLKGDADMTIATFPPSAAGGGFGLAVRLARWGIFKLTGQRVTTPLSGQRCVIRRLLETCGGLEQGFGVETALTIDALRAGFRILEVKTEMAHRVTGRDWRGIRHRARQFRDIAWTLIRRATR